MILPYININPPQVYTCSPSWTLLHPSPYCPSGSSQCTSPKHPVSCIKPGLVIRFIYDIIHVSVPFSQIILPSCFPIESKKLFYFKGINSSALSFLYNPTPTSIHDYWKNHSLACCDSWGCKESDMTEWLNWTELNWID